MKAGPSGTERGEQCGGVRHAPTQREWRHAACRGCVKARRKAPRQGKQGPFAKHRPSMSEIDSSGGSSGRLAGRRNWPTQARERRNETKMRRGSGEMPRENPAEIKSRGYKASGEKLEAATDSNSRRWEREKRRAKPTRKKQSSMQQQSIASSQRPTSRAYPRPIEIKRAGRSRCNPSSVQRAERSQLVGRVSAGSTIQIHTAANDGRASSKHHEL